MKSLPSQIQLMIDWFRLLINLQSMPRMRTSASSIKVHPLMMNKVAKEVRKVRAIN